MQEHGVFKGLRINLYGSYLNDADLREAHLEKAILAKAHLQGTILFKAHLQEANLRDARLQKAVLEEAHLQGVRLLNAYLQGANLKNVLLQGANLEGAGLQETLLDKAHLEGIRSTDWSPSEPVEDYIRNQIGKETDLLGVVFEGGLSREDVDSSVEGLSDERAEELRKHLEIHIGKPKINKLPKDSCAITGAYNRRRSRTMDCRIQRSHVRSAGGR